MFHDNRMIIEMLILNLHDKERNVLINATYGEIKMPAVR